MRERKSRLLFAALPLWGKEKGPGGTPLVVFRRNHAFATRRTRVLIFQHMLASGVCVDGFMRAFCLFMVRLRPYFVFWLMASLRMLAGLFFFIGSGFYNV